MFQCVMEEVDPLLDNECLDCFEDFGPPPDDILRIPPPPLPFFIKLDQREHFLCNNQCIGSPKFQGIEFIDLGQPWSYQDRIWLLIFCASCLGILILGGLITFLIFKLRTKIKTRSDSDSIVRGTSNTSNTDKTNDCESVLYPFPATSTGDGRVLWATLSPGGTTRHYTAPNSRPDVTLSYSSSSKPCLPPPEPPPVGFIMNTNFIDSDSQTPLMECFQLNEFVELDGTTSHSVALMRNSTHNRPRVSSPTRIENPNLPPLNLHPHRTFRKATIQRRDSDFICSSPT